MGTHNIGLHHRVNHHREKRIIKHLVNETFAEAWIIPAYYGEGAKSYDAVNHDVFNKISIEYHLSVLRGDSAGITGVTFVSLILQ